MAAFIGSFGPTRTGVSALRGAIHSLKANLWTVLLRGDLRVFHSLRSIAGQGMEAFIIAPGSSLQLLEDSQLAAIRSQVTVGLNRWVHLDFSPTCLLVEHNHDGPQVSKIPSLIKQFRGQKKPMILYCGKFDPAYGRQLIELRNAGFRVRAYGAWPLLSNQEEHVKSDLSKYRKALDVIRHCRIPLSLDASSSVSRASTLFLSLGFARVSLLGFDSFNACNPLDNLSSAFGLSSSEVESSGPYPTESIERRGFRASWFIEQLSQLVGGIVLPPDSTAGKCTPRESPGRKSQVASSSMRENLK